MNHHDHLKGDLAQLKFSFSDHFPGVRGCSGPYVSPWSFTNVNEVFLDPQTIVTVGSTVAAEDALQHDLVEILTPVFCYVNKSFFNQEFRYFERLT